MANLHVILGLLFFACGERIDANDDFDESDKQDLSDLINDVRVQAKATNMRFMEWNDDLANKAKEDVDSCDSTSVNPEEAVNIYKGVKVSPWTLIAGWKKPIIDPAMEGFECTAIGGSCSYVQMIVAEGTTFGCAQKKCVEGSDENYMVACRFDKRYKLKKRPFKSAISCSECGGNGAKCNLREGLCMTREQCEVSPDKCECRLQCDAGVLDEDMCECHCTDCATGKLLRSGADHFNLSIIRITTMGTIFWITNVQMHSTFGKKNEWITS